MKVLEPWQVVMDHRVALFFRQERQDRQAALADPQRYASADVTGKGANRKRPFTAVQADRIKPAARQQEQRITQ
ncbi:hypothetical protein D3C73_1531630 [compost metagenome]